MGICLMLSLIGCTAANDYTKVGDAVIINVKEVNDLQIVKQADNGPSTPYVVNVTEKQVLSFSTNRYTVRCRLKSASGGTRSNARES